MELIETWAPIDRSHRKLAHRGSYTETVFVSPATVRRVAEKHDICLPGEPSRPRPPAPKLPQAPWQRNRIWMGDASHFTRARRVTYAIIDVVTRYWIATVVTAEQACPQAQLLGWCPNAGVKAVLGAAPDRHVMRRV